MKRADTCIEVLESRIAPANFTVTNLLDAGPGSLRQAIFDANNSSGADTITFAHNLHGAIKLTSDLPAITDSLTITGPGTSRLTINGEQHQLIQIEGSSLSVDLSKVKLTGGFAADGGAVAINDPGGSVLLDHVVLTANHAVGDGTSPGNGGGLAVLSGTVTLHASHITANGAGAYNSVVNPFTLKTSVEFQTTGLGGGIDVAAGGNLTIIASIIHGNSAGGGGGIYNAGQLLVESHSALSANIAQIIRGGTLIARGGGLLNDTGGTATLDHSNVTGNKAIGSAGVLGGLDASAPPTPGGDAAGGGIYNAAGSLVTITGAHITGNKAAGGMGGSGIAGADGVAGIGGGAPGERGGTGGKGANGGNAIGGGIANDGTLTLQKSVISGNVAMGGEGGVGGLGGTGGMGGGSVQTYGGGYILVGETSGRGGPGGYGGAGGTGGTGKSAGIYDSTGTVVVIKPSIVSGNTQRNGARGPMGEYGDRGPSADGYTANNY